MALPRLYIDFALQIRFQNPVRKPPERRTVAATEKMLEAKKVFRQFRAEKFGVGAPVRKSKGLNFARPPTGNKCARVNSQKS
jgi:hypothetical protein